MAVLLLLIVKSGVLRVVLLTLFSLLFLFGDAGCGKTGGGGGGGDFIMVHGVLF